MTQTQFKKELDRELEKLNAKIDLKILWGQDYFNDSLRHKKLLAETRKLIRKERKGNWFKALFNSPVLR